jgi:hypothetical protein
MKLTRILWAVAALAAGSLTSSQVGGLATAQPQIELQPAGPQKGVGFRDRLIVGLRAMSPSDVDFVDRVVNRVQNGRLPQRMVDETFFWARDRAAKRGGKARRPIIYFRPAMSARARAIGVAL